MRITLQQLLDKTLVFEYALPHQEKGIDKSVITNEKDSCYSAVADLSLADLIYNGIIDFAKVDENIDLTKLNLIQRQVLASKIRYQEEDAVATKQKYGFYGEVILNLILQKAFRTKVLLAKGYLYNPLENSETKGYDAYQFYYANDTLMLFWGEVKFHESVNSAVTDILKNITKATSENYFNRNILAIMNERNNISNLPKLVSDVIDRWEECPEISLYQEMEKHSIKLFYPMLVIYNQHKPTYDETIKDTIKKVEEICKKEKFNISIGIDVHLFFILLPVQNAAEIKKEVIKWISQNKQLK